MITECCVICPLLNDICEPDRVIVNKRLAGLCVPTVQSAAERYKVYICHNDYLFDFSFLFTEGNSQVDKIGLFPMLAL